MPPARRRQCGAMQAYEELAETYPAFRDNQARIHEFARRSIETGEAQRTARRLITIPVVVHVVYKRQAQNISNAQIKSQVDRLNRDFRATNPDRSQTPAVWQGLIGDARSSSPSRSETPAANQPTGSRGRRPVGTRSRPRAIR